jgi:hypothetical protein
MRWPSPSNHRRQSRSSDWSSGQAPRGERRVKRPRSLSRTRIELHSRARTRSDHHPHPCPRTSPPTRDPRSRAPRCSSSRVRNLGPRCGKASTSRAWGSVPALRVRRRRDRDRRHRRSRRGRAVRWTTSQRGQCRSSFARARPTTPPLPRPRGRAALPSSTRRAPRACPPRRRGRAPW